MQASCQCGNLTAEINDGAEAMTVMCHCVDCQRRSGSPFGVISYYEKAEVCLFGPSKQFTRPCDSGETFTTGFCPECGSTVYALPGKYRGLIGITIGTIADPSTSRLPDRSVYEQSRHEWVKLPQMPRHPRGRDT